MNENPYKSPKLNDEHTAVSTSFVQTIDRIDIALGISGSAASIALFTGMEYKIQAAIYSALIAGFVSGRFMYKNLMKNLDETGAILYDTSQKTDVIIQKVEAIKSEES